MRKIIMLILLPVALSHPLNSQDLHQTLKGKVTDRETGEPLTGAYVLESGSSTSNITTTDASGNFRLTTGIGRVTLKISYIGYEDLLIKDILVASGKEVEINTELREKVIQTSDVVVRSDRSGNTSINQMATISTNTIRTDDALRYAGGFYDPSRIVNSFAGVITSNDDASNDIIIRGNSSRGLLWRLEGIEIPNPNHFSDGQGGSGGAFSAISSNVIANFDFFTGAFPAEFGNASSGVMDLNLRKGNSDKHEYAFQTGMIGGEVALEGPFSWKSKSSYLINARYTNFKILSDLDLIDLGETNYAPRTKDLVFNINLPFKKSGNLNLFGVYGSSELGKIAVHDTATWDSSSDRWEEMEKQSSGILGIKYYYVIPDVKTYIRSVFTYSFFSNSYSEGYIDSSYIRENSYLYEYKYPALRFALLVNHKLSSNNTLRGGINYHYLTGDMSNLRLNSSDYYDTLVAPEGHGSLWQGYIQWKNRPVSGLEINTGFHVIGFSLNKDVYLEPRLGLRWEAAPGYAFIAGFGLHSRIESLAVYNSLIKNSDGVRTSLNHDMDLSRSFHAVTGLDLSPFKDLRIRIEGYIQYLFNVPVVNKITSQYSTINTAERLPEAKLENTGTGMNNGVELTIEKSFTKNYYFLITGSFFDSWYKAGDEHKYNTYYNTRYVSNILAGKDFYVGKNHRNNIGLNAKCLFRGGYRYTPVDEKRTIKNKRIIYQTWATYEAQLPDFIRLDAGINFRRNHPRYSWIIMLDIQNASNRRNVFKRRFTYENGQIVSNDILSLGMVPVFNFRLQF
jgi:hypothetical protein